MAASDRVAQTVAKLVLEPTFEADLENNSFGYRPARGAVDAVKQVHWQMSQGYTDVVIAQTSFSLSGSARPSRSLALTFRFGFVGPMIHRIIA